MGRTRSLSPPPLPSPPLLPLLLLLLLSAGIGILPVHAAGHVSVSPITTVPDWLKQSAMTLHIMTHHGVALRPYTVAPLTASSGLNQTETARADTVVDGTITLTTAANYANATGRGTIAYISCDALGGAVNMTSSDIVNSVMGTKPSAILLYTTEGGYCGLGGVAGVSYQTFYTMVDPAQAEEAVNITSYLGGAVRATIVGNSSAGDGPGNGDDGTDGKGKGSSVAMSILYCITAVIAMLFLTIIATGAIRAYRHPERYGPRSADGGRARQSRARGIARAVLDTLPVVKFGDSQPAAKTDPGRELESQHPRLSGVSERWRPQSEEGHDMTPCPPYTSLDAEAAGVAGQGGPRGSGEEDHLECSICADDFTVGEDVRVLPCNHKFHPACIDPWLINVSGTCPLCRLDLRTRKVGNDPDGREAGVAADGVDVMYLSPPLNPEATDTAAPATQGRRGPGVLDARGLLHASVQERIEILRRHRSQRQEPYLATEQVTGSSTARLSERLREIFRIRTRTRQRGAPV